MLYSLSSGVDDGALNEIQAAEQELGTALLAFRAHDLEPARLSEDQMSQIKALEKDLGLVLVAVAA